MPQPLRSGTNDIRMLKSYAWLLCWFLLRLFAFGKKVSWRWYVICGWSASDKRFVRQIMTSHACVSSSSLMSSSYLTWTEWKWFQKREGWVWWVSESECVYFYYIIYSFFFFFYLFTNWVGFKHSLHTVFIIKGNCAKVHWWQQISKQQNTNRTVVLPLV